MKDFVRGENKHIVQNLLILATVSSLRTIYRGDTKAAFFFWGGGTIFGWFGRLGFFVFYWQGGGCFRLVGIFRVLLAGGGVFSVGLVGWDFSCPGGRGVLG